MKKLVFVAMTIILIMVSCKTTKKNSCVKCYQKCVKECVNKYGVTGKDGVTRVKSHVKKACELSCKDKYLKQ